MSDLSPLFENKRRSSDALMSLLNNFYSESYGDRHAISQVLNSFYKASNKQRISEIASLKLQMKNVEIPILSGSSYDKLLNEIDLTFQTAFHRCYSSFCSLGVPLIADNERDILISSHKNLMPNCFNAMMKMLGMDLKSNSTKNEVLMKTGFYERRIFYMFLSQSRIRNN